MDTVLFQNAGCWSNWNFAKIPTGGVGGGGFSGISGMFWVGMCHPDLQIWTPFNMKMCAILRPYCHVIMPI